MLRPNDKAQIEMVIGGIAELLITVAGGKESVLALPGPENCFDATAQYGIDGVTEKVRNNISKLKWDALNHTLMWEANLLP